MRVVSLVPSASETLVAWGSELVAVTRFCELGDRYPTVGGTKDPDLDAIVALRPDVVVMCDQENRRPDAEALIERGLPVHVIRIAALEDVGPQMVAMAKAVGVDESLGSACAASVDPRPDVRHVAFVPIWKRPWMTIGRLTYGASLLRALGISLVANENDERYPTIDPDEARDLGASIVLAPSEPYPFSERHRAVLESVAPTVFVDGQDLFWWGVRTPAALGRLGAQLND